MRKTPFWRRHLRLLGSDPAADVDAELEFHLEMRVEDLVRRGLTEAEARERAAREFGDVARVRGEMEQIGRERLRRQKRSRRWESLAQDVRFAMRTVRRAPGFAAIVIATLALGIGGTTAVFSVVRAVLLAPLPYQEPGALVRLYQADDGEGAKGFVSGPHFKEVRDRAGSFESVAALYTYAETGLDLAEGGRPERLRTLKVSRDYFRTLGAGPLRGRGFGREDEAGLPRVVLSDRVWRARFGADPALLGSTVRLSAEPYTVVGIAPAGLEDPVVGPVDAWIPVDLLGSDADEVQNHHVSVGGRLRGGVGVDGARSELASINRTLAERWPDAAGDSLVLFPLKEDLVGASSGTLYLLLGAVGMVLLVACVNVANLFLVRSTARVREFAIRSALGSGGGRIARQLLVESVVLAVPGGLLGLAVAVLGVRGLRALGRDAIPRLDEVAFDPAVLAFAALVTLATGIAFGVAPALRFARVQPATALREQSRGATGSRAQGRARNGLAAGQIALALTLLAGAGVLVVSYARLSRVDLGFQPDRALTFEVALPAARYDAARRAAFREELDRRVAAIPGVAAAGGISRLPATGSYHSWGAAILTGPRAGAGRDSWTSGEQRTVSGDLFRALGIPLRTGRLFDERDAAGAPAVVVVSESFAREAFPGLPLEQVVGQRIAPIKRERTIVGVVGDVALDPRGQPAPIVYHAHRQFADNRNWVLSHVASSALPPERILPAVRAAVAALDPELVVHRAAPLSEVVGRGVGRERFTLALMSAFAAVALALASLGLYGVLAYAVRQRTREIGIRVALGATAASVRGLVLRHAAAVVGLGVAGGLAGALVLGRWLSSLVFDTSPWDPRIFLATALLLAAVAFVSAWLPARRAARVEPRIAMGDT